MTAANADDFWRKAVNELAAGLPEDGIGSPEMETIAEPKKPTKEGSKKVVVHKIITHIYVITDIAGKQYTSTASQKMQNFGTMTLSRAIKLVELDNLS